MAELTLSLAEHWKNLKYYDGNTPENLDKSFAIYKDLLVSWNEKIDITAITDSEEIDRKHFLDSLLVFQGLPMKKNSKVIDIGTGGGFPGIPMKICRPDLQMTLLDSLNKRIVFLQEVIETLSLSMTKAIHGRAEELARRDEYRERYDIAVSRAVAALPTLLEYCLPFVCPGGVFVAMKGPAGLQEIKDASRALDTLGGKVEKVETYHLGEDERTLVVIRKVRTTPKKYPRGQGKPRKAPL